MSQLPQHAGCFREGKINIGCFISGRFSFPPTNPIQPTISMMKSLSPLRIALQWSGWKVLFPSHRIQLMETSFLHPNVWLVFTSRSYLLVLTLRIRAFSPSKKMALIFGGSPKNTQNAPQNPRFFPPFHWEGPWGFHPCFSGRLGSTPAARFRPVSPPPAVALYLHWHYVTWTLGGAKLVTSPLWATKKKKRSP